METNRVVKPAVYLMAEYAKAGALSDDDRRALLDALGHSPDCVAPDHYRKVWQEERDRYDDAIDCLHDMTTRFKAERDRAERAERERDRLRDLVRAAGALISESHITCPEHLWEEYVNACADAGLDIEGEDLSADADADAEPGTCATCGEPKDYPGCECMMRDPDAEPSRAEYGETSQAAAASPQGSANERPKSLNELSDEWGLCRPPCTKPAGHENRCNAGAMPSRHQFSCDCGSRTVDKHNNVVHDVDCAAGEYPPLAHGFQHVPKPDPAGMGTLKRSSTAEGDEWPEPDCRNHKHSRSPAFGRTHLCPKCGRYTFSPRAEGGRPREADAEGSGNPIRTGDASVDGGGDDGRSRDKHPCRACHFGHHLSCEDQRCECCGRGYMESVAAAVHQAYLDTCARLGWPVKPENNVGYDDLSEESKELDRATAQAAIDAALASGGVLDVMEHKKALEAEAAKADEWKARVREIEAVLDSLFKAVDALDRAGWLLCRAIESGNADQIEHAVARYEASHESVCFGPEAPLSRARVAYWGEPHNA